MRDSDDDTGTRPISVAELLAKNGAIGAPPAGGRRRRRRGNSDAVTVAELTGEIPIIAADTAKTSRTVTPSRPEPVVEKVQPEPEPEAVAEPEPAVEPEVVEPVAEPEPIAEAEPTGEPEPAEEPVTDSAEPAAEPELAAEPEPVLTEAEADYAAHLERRNADPNPLDFRPLPRRVHGSKATGTAIPVSGAERMSPDPVVDDDEMLDLGPDEDFSGVFDEHASSADLDESELEESDLDDEHDVPVDDVSSYSRSNSDTLFGGDSVADDLARRGVQQPEDAEAVPADVEQSEKNRKPGGGSAFVRGAWVVAQCVLAVAFGAGLFIAFDQLWRWNTIVALVLSVLVILGLVVGVRVVRKTEDIGSTLIAVAVGALVTLGPLALLQSH